MTQLLSDPTELQSRLSWLLSKRISESAPGKSFDVVLSHFEVNDKHGTGVLLRKIFGASPDIFSIRTYSYYNSENYLGERNLALAHDSLSRAETYAHVLQALRGWSVRRVVSVPFFTHELWTGIALHDAFGAPLCTYVMDDRNVYDPHIPDSLFREALEKSALRLAISPEMRAEYERKLGLKFWLLPPVVSSRLMPQVVQAPSAELTRARTGVLVGNIKSQVSLNLLRQATRGTGLEVHWYGDVDRSLRFTPEELAADGIVYRGFIDQRKLAELLSRYPYAILPTSPLRDDPREAEEESHTARAIAKLSWPSRISFIMATSHTPILVLGSPATAAARAVERLHIGRSAAYESSEFHRAVAHLCSGQAQQQMRNRAFELAPRFRAEGVADWIWRSMEHGAAIDDRYESLPGQET